MPLRLVEYSPPDDFSFPEETLETYQVTERRRLMTTDGQVVERVLIDAEHAEGFVEWLHNRIGASEARRILLLPVQASIPRIEENENDPEENQPQSASKGRVSRDELYHDVEDSISVSGIYYAFVVLSTIVAAGGMLRDSVAVVIGAMVIAPLMGPNIALALGTTLGDTDLLRKALWINLTGLLIAFGLSVVAGLIFPIDVTVGEVYSRTVVSLSDLLLALAAGAAGALSITRGAPTALVGVMVAVALLPPLVAFGMLVGSAHWHWAYGAFLLLLSNIVCVNLAAVCTFLIQGIRPMGWYEVEQAKRSTRLAVLLWTVALVLLVVAIWLAPTPDLPLP